MKIENFMSSLAYSKKVIDLLRNPKNMGKIKNPNGVATVGNPVCGDTMRLYLKVAKKGNQEIIKEIKFQTLGCAAAIATSSILTEMVKGKTIKEALKFKNKDIVRKLGGLPEAKTHCSLLAIKALQKAIKNYQNKS